MNFYLKQIIIITICLSFIECYNNTLLVNVTAKSIEKYSKDDGYEGCYALYDRGANKTETCTQFKLEYPYICCKVHYEVDGYKNDFCMPIANNPDAIGDIVSSFDNADELEIDCHSKMIKFIKHSILIIYILLF